MSAPAAQDFEQLAEALARLLAAYWRQRVTSGRESVGHQCGDANEQPRSAAQEVR